MTWTRLVFYVSHQHHLPYEFVLDVREQSDRKQKQGEMLGEFPLGQPLTIEWVGTALAIPEPYLSHGSPNHHGPAAIVKVPVHLSQASNDSNPFHLAFRRQ